MDSLPDIHEPSKENPPRNGYELVSAILDDHRGGIEALLRFVDSQENEWLEFKASIRPESGSFEADENQHDLYWHVTKAIIAIANSVGGAVILGLNDEGQAVGLEASDPNNVLKTKGLDAFKLDVLRAVYLRPKGWKCKKDTWEIRDLDRLEHLVALKNASYQGKALAIFLVKPLSENELLEVNSRQQQRMIFIRARGDIGRTNQIQTYTEIKRYEQNRRENLNSPEFSGLWQKFLNSLPTLDRQRQEERSEALATAYCQRIQHEKIFNCWHTLYTPLNADESLPMFEQEAEETWDMYRYEDEDDVMKDAYEDSDELLPTLPAPRHGGVFELLKQESRAVLLGEPGAGKTTCLRRLTWDAAKHYLPGAILALFVPLSRYTANGLRSLLTLMAMAEVDNRGMAIQIEWRDLEYLISQKRLRMLLDAFNECPLHLQTQCCQDICGMLQDYPGLLMIVSSRASAFPCQLRLPTFTVRPLDRDQQHRFLATYLLDEDKAVAILTQVYQQPGGELIASRPIFLHIVFVVSKEGDLPQGHALLYRQFFKYWFDREQKKEINTGTKLPWTQETTCEALAHLAFHTRQQGQVICDVDLAEGILTPLLHERTRAFLERMAQGLLLTMNDEDATLAFEHETIQEYLAAEYLIRHPDQLKKLTEDSYAIWWMVLAYAFELKTLLPEVFVQAAWRLDPLLVAVALRDDSQLLALPIDETWNPWLRGVLRAMRNEEVLETYQISNIDMSLPPQSFLATLRKSVFWYAAVTHPLGILRLTRFKKLIVSHDEPWADMLRPACEGYPTWLTEWNDQTPLLCSVGLQKIDDTFTTNPSSFNQSLQLRLNTTRHNFTLAALQKALEIDTNFLFTRQAILLFNNVNCRENNKEIRKYLYANKSSLQDHWQGWFLRQNEYLSVHLAISNLVRYDLLDKKIVRQSIPCMEELTENATVNELCSLMALIRRDDISQTRCQSLLVNSTIKQLVRLAGCGLVRREDFSPDKLKSFIESLGNWEFFYLKKSGFINSKDFPQKKKKKKNNSQTGQLINLANTGLIRREDLSPSELQSLVKVVTAGQAAALVGQGILRREDFPPGILQSFVKCMTAGQAASWLAQGLLRGEDIPSDKLQSFIKEITAGQAAAWVRHGILHREDFSEIKIKEFVEASGPTKALLLLSGHILKVSDFDRNKFDELVNRAEPYEKRLLITYREVEDPAKTVEISNYFVFTKEILHDPGYKELSILILLNKFFDMVVLSTLAPNHKSGFLSNHLFFEAVYFQCDLISNLPENGLFIGDVISAEIKLLFKKNNNNESNFVMKQGLFVKRSANFIPPWWQAWRIYVPRFIMASTGQYLFDQTQLEHLQTEGFDISHLCSWQPSEKDGLRLQLLESIMADAMKSTPINAPENRKQLHDQLQGDGIWASLRQMTDAYLDGQEMMRSIKQLPNFKPKIFPGTKAIHNPAAKMVLSSKNLPFSSAIPRLTSFGEKATELTIYVDEAWPGTIPNATRPLNEGVIAGIVCYGNPQLIFSGLPPISTHSYKDVSMARSTLQNLLQCEQCLPFIFPFTLPDQSEPAIRHYDNLLQHAIKLLLGWVLPQTSSAGRQRVNLFFELIGGHKVGENCADFIQGLLAANPERYDRWIVGTARWEGKEYGYIPYADLIAHLTLEHTEKNRQLGLEFNYTKWPGYIPFSLELVPRLGRLEHLETAHNIDDVLDFVRDTADSHFGQLVLSDLATRLLNQPKIQERLLEALEQRYQNKVSDLTELRRLFLQVRQMIGELPAQASPRLQLLDHLTILQNANHNGDPVRIRVSAERYASDRAQLKENERELCAYTDLNLAVHYADRFEFSCAEVTVSEWVRDPLFPALSFHQRGRLYSALGQYRAMQNDSFDAAQWFTKALACFKQIPEADKRAGEINQTSIYLAINGLDACFPNALALVEEVTGSLDQAAERYSVDDSLADQYHHHLLLRCLYYWDDSVETARTRYLSQAPAWQEGWPQHPWPLIHLYRALLLWRDGDGADETFAVASEWFDKALMIVGQGNHGATVQLISGMIATVATCCFDDPRYMGTARRLLDSVRPQLPATAGAVDALYEILSAPQPDKINVALAALPFNYH